MLLFLRQLRSIESFQNLFADNKKLSTLDVLRITHADFLYGRSDYQFISLDEHLSRSAFKIVERFSNTHKELLN